MLHPIGYNPEGREYIPQAFLDKIAKAMLDNTVSAIISEYAIDKQLINDKMTAVFKESVSLVCYVNGIAAETVDLFLVPKEYHVRLTECADANYKALAEEVLESSVTYKETIDAYKKIDGNSEEKSSVEQYQYQCDLNNDGVPERYNKSIWTGDWEYLDFSGEGKGIACVRDAKKTVEGTPMMLWVEQFGEENIINIISLTELDDFEITGFLINGKTYKRLYRITANTIYDVCQERSNM